MFEGVDGKWKIVDFQVMKEGLAVVHGLGNSIMVGRLMIYGLDIGAHGMKLN